MAKRQVFSATQVKMHILVDVLNERAFSSSRVRKGEYFASFLISIDIGGGKEGLVPLAREIST